MRAPAAAGGSLSGGAESQCVKFLALVGRSSGVYVARYSNPGR